MTWNASQAQWSTERILDFLLKAGQLGKVSIACGMPRLELDLPCGAKPSQARGPGAAIVSLSSRRIS